MERAFTGVPASTIDEKSEREKRLDALYVRLRAAIEKAKLLVERRKQGEVIPDFDIRGELYDLGLEVAPEARADEFTLFQRDFVRPREGMKVADIAAGTGFHTLPLMRVTKGVAFAVDPSKEQLRLLKGHADAEGMQVETVCMTPDSEDVLEKLPNDLDLVMSYGGTHHVENQRRMFEMLATRLKVGGRIVIGDVCKDTDLSHHFDTFVAANALTGHTAQWFNEEILESMAQSAGLKLTRIERVPLQWKFHSKREMALFFVGLHAYDLPDEQIIADLSEALGVEERDGIVYLNWPMLFFEMTKVE